VAVHGWSTARAELDRALGIGRLLIERNLLSRAGSSAA